TIIDRRYGRTSRSKRSQPWQTTCRRHVRRCFMAIPNTIKAYLQENGINYWHKTHPVAFTTMETAALEHVPGREVAKVVVLKADKRFIMAVLPADRVIQMDTLRRVAGAQRLRLATESEFI